MSSKNLIEKIHDLFILRKDTYAIQQIKEGTVKYKRVGYRLSDHVIRKHLKGEQTIGIYPYPDKTKWLMFDIDTPDPEMVQEIVKTAVALGLHAYVEDSGNKGYHGWLFFDDLADISLTKKLAARIFEESLNETIREIEVFPKQTSKTADFGSCIKLPLGIHQMTKRKCDFVDPVAFSPLPFPDFLWDIRKISIKQIEALLRRELKGSLNEIKPCIQKSIDQGADEGERNKWCFRISCECKRLSFSKVKTRRLIYSWLPKNRGQTEFTKDEADAVMDNAYKKHNIKYGCKDKLLIQNCIGKESCGYFQEFITLRTGGNVERNIEISSTNFRGLMFEEFGWPRILKGRGCYLYRIVIPELERRKNVKIGGVLITNLRELARHSGESKNKVRNELALLSTSGLIKLTWGNIHREGTRIHRVVPMPKPSHDGTENAGSR